MGGTRTQFPAELAPCGKTVGGELYCDDDQDGLVMYDRYYSCGCRRIQHQYHDGSYTTRAIRHGSRQKVVHDEHTEHPV
jgi:hypothetical protein